MDLLGLVGGVTEKCSLSFSFFLSVFLHLNITICCLFYFHLDSDYGDGHYRSLKIKIEEDGRKSSWYGGELGKKRDKEKKKNSNRQQQARQRILV